jgi:hypothetical protein
MARPAVCHISGGELPARAGVVRRLLPLAFGLVAAGLLVLLYLGMVTWAQGWKHSLELLGQDRALVAAIATGLGVQVGLYSYLRLVVHYGIKLAMPTATTGVGTGTSSVAMVACCIHHVTDVLPVMGLSGAAIFLNQYRIPFMVVGMVVNAAGVAIMLRVVVKGRAHLRAMQGQAATR